MSLLVALKILCRQVEVGGSWSRGVVRSSGGGVGAAALIGRRRRREREKRGVNEV